MNTQINPPTIAPPAANYAHAVLTEGATRWLHVSGVVPTMSDGSTPADLADQAAAVWANIAAILDSGSMGSGDIVSVTTYVVTGEPLAPVMAARDAFMGDARCASTLVTVSALANPAWRLEIAIVAASS